MSKTSISWSEYSWNPITGCSKISEGCRRCYAEKMAYRLQGMGLNKYRNGFKVTLHPEVIEEPLKMRKSHMIFVCSMSDIFHSDVSNEFILDIFDVMKEAKHHTFQILTKRSDRLRQMDADGLLEWSDNIWAGVTVENDKAYHRIDDLVATTAHIKWLSVEPYIGEVDISDWSVDWVVAGGESGAGAQKVNAEWVRGLRDQCIASETAFFFKQWGGMKKKANGCMLDGKIWHQYPV